MRPPWFTERLLRSFIENPEVSEDVLGDLTEEWRERSERQGPRAASWWYRKQAARSVVHLFRSGWVPAPTPAVFGAALAASLLLLLFTGWAGWMTSTANLAMGMFGSAGSEGGEILPLTRTAPAVWAARALMASFACGFIGGLLLGLLSRTAEMVQVTLLSGTCVPCALALQMFAPEGWPEWYGATLPVVLTLSTFAGGIGGVAMKRSGRRPPAHGGTRVL
jgi:hypothetical protein